MSQPSATTSEELQELDRASDAPLELIWRTPGFGGRSILMQARRPVTAIEPTHAAWYLSTAHERWRAVTRRRPRRLGWCLEVNVGRRPPVLHYYPRSLLLGGSLILRTDADRYKLRCPLLGARQWTLASDRDGKFANIKLWRGRPPAEATRARALRPGLASEATDEPQLPLLLAVASLAIVVHHQQPTDAGGGGGGVI
jgi:hypothetical protein